MAKDRRLNRQFVKTVMVTTIGTVILAVVSPLQVAAKAYSSINIFGDSLVDSGNIFTLTGFPPSPPYAQKLSNGTVWVEPLADALGLSPALSAEVLPEIAAGISLPPADGINFALSGSFSSDLNAGGASLPGLQQQIAAYQAIAPLTPPTEDALFILLAGANDYNRTIASSNLQALPNQVTDNLAAAATGLIEAGAQNLLIANLPNLGLQPLTQQLNQVVPGADTILTQLTAEHNRLLEQKIEALEAATGANIIELDLDSLFEEVTRTPDSFGFTNISDACFIEAQSGVPGSICDNPDEFVFWDQVHPTEAAHDQIAQRALDTLALAMNSGSGNPPQEVPEPGNILALGLLGGLAAIARKRSAASKSA